MYYLVYNTHLCGWCLLFFGGKIGLPASEFIHIGGENVCAYTRAICGCALRHGLGENKTRDLSSYCSTRVVFLKHRFEENFIILGRYLSFW